MTRTMRLSSLVLALALVASFAAACGSTVSGTVDDASITTRVKTIFINDLLVGGERIDVETFKGVVTLSGQVKTKQHEEKAIALARTIRGVTDVKSNLKVGQ
jgi:osmotically-inducible protein OsmY